MDDYQTVDPFVWKGIEQEVVNHAEHDSRRGNAKREREHRGSREPQTLSQRPRTVAQVLCQRFEKSHASRLPAFFFDALNPAKLQPRPPRCFMARHTAAHQILRIRLHVKAQFRVHFALHPRAPQRCPPPRTESSPQPHSSSSIAPNIPRCPLLIRTSAPPSDPHALHGARGGSLQSV